MTGTHRSFYVWVRDLHLYFGLFVSPVLVVFAISAIFLNHPWLLSPADDRKTSSLPAVMEVEVPTGLDRLEGMERIEKIKPVLRQAGVSGEIAFIRFVPEENRMVIPVMKPGEEIRLDVNLEKRRMTIERRAVGLWETLIYLHKSPGPHLANIRGNWRYTRLWHWLADGTVYLLLFLSISGVYLWAVLRAERKIGLVLLGAGAASFVGIIYALTA